MNLHDFHGIELPGGIQLLSVAVTSDELTDALGRPALARTVISGASIRVELAEGQGNDDISISLYHELLEAMALAVDDPPQQVMDMNEADFETAANQWFQRLGEATPARLNEMLKNTGF